MRQEANKVVHKLARVALSLKDSCIYVDEPPEFIIETLVNDVTMFENQKNALHGFHKKKRLSNPHPSQRYVRV
jgi:hypothetical protein